MKQIDLLWLSPLYVVLVKVSQVKGVGDTFGSQFLLYLPMYYNLNVKYDLSLFTLQQNNLKVYLTSHHSVQDLSSVLYVARVRPVLYTITPNLTETETQPRKNTYQLMSSRGLFSLMVYVSFLNVSFESMTAIPVNIWGTRYSFNTIEMNPFVYVVTVQANEISVTLYGDNIMKYFGPQKEIGRQRKSFSVSLEEYGGRELFQSNTYDVFCCDLLAIWIESMISPIGVIVGSIIDDANKRNKFKAKGGFTLEMLLPPGNGEKNYFIPDLVSGFCKRCTWNYVSEAAAVFVSTFRNLSDVWQFDPTEKYSTIVEVLSAWLGRVPTQVTHTIYKHVMVSSESESHNVVISAMSLTLPSTFYARFYFWCTADIKDIQMTHYAVFVVEKYSLGKGFNFDGEDISGTLELRLLEFGNLQSIYGLAQCLSGKMMISVGSHECYLKTYMPFGLYLYGIASDYLYMHPAGFVTFLNQRKVKSLYNYIKRKAPNDTNIDAGSLVKKEDLRYYPPQPVTWGEWYTWSCPNCTTNQSLQYRRCIEEPRGLYYHEHYDCNQESEEDRNGFCSNMCSNIEIGKWSVWSNWECRSDCTSPLMFRKRDCVFDNIKEKSKDCDGPSNEHKDGDCKSNCPEAVINRLPSRLWLLLLVIPVALLLYLRLSDRPSDTPEEKLTLESVVDPKKTGSKSSILSRLSTLSKALLGLDKSSAPGDDLYKYDEKYGTNL